MGGICSAYRETQPFSELVPKKYTAEKYELKNEKKNMKFSVTIMKLKGGELK